MRHLITLKYIDAVARAGSIRKAAEKMSITSTALNRRVLAMEEDMGVAIFERLPNGVRLSTAGEILIQHIRAQLSDIERIQTQIADLKGERRGHIKIASGQAAMTELLPELITEYRQQHPAVTFEVMVCNRHDSETLLADYSADIAIIFETVKHTEFHSLIDIPQQPCMVCSTTHELSDSISVRLSQCLDFPLALPTPNNGLRLILDRAVAKNGGTLSPAIQSDNYDFLNQCLCDGTTLSFQLPIALPTQRHELKERGLCAIPIDSRDVPPGFLSVGQLRGRTLPVAAARFSDSLANVLDDRFGNSQLQRPANG